VFEEPLQANMQPSHAVTAPPPLIGGIPGYYYTFEIAVPIS